MIRELDFLLECECSEEYVEEASFHINKNRLNDEAYVKELISDIKTPGKQVKLTTGNILALIAFTVVPVGTITPASLALCALVNTALYSFVMGATYDSQEANSKRKIITGIDKLIRKLEKQKAKAGDSDKKRIESEIKKLEHNRSLVEKMN